MSTMLDYFESATPATTWDAGNSGFISTDGTISIQTISTICPEGVQGTERGWIVSVVVWTPDTATQDLEIRMYYDNVLISTGIWCYETEEATSADVTLFCPVDAPITTGHIRLECDYEGAMEISLTDVCFTILAP